MFLHSHTLKWYKKIIRTFLFGVPHSIVLHWQCYIWVLRKFNKYVLRCISCQCISTYTEDNETIPGSIVCPTSRVEVLCPELLQSCIESLATFAEIGVIGVTQTCKVNVCGYPLLSNIYSCKTFYIYIYIYIWMCMYWTQTFRLISEAPPKILAFYWQS